LDGHLSKRPTRGSSEQDYSSLLFGLAPGGVYKAPHISMKPGVLLPHRFTIACVFNKTIGRLLSVALSIASQRLRVTEHPCPVVSGLSSPANTGATICSSPCTSINITRKSVNVKKILKDGRRLR